GDDYLHDTFMKVVYIAKEMLEREIAKAMEKVEGMKKVRLLLDTATDKRIIIMEEPLPWERVLVPARQTLFVVYPRREGNWGAIGVPVAVSGFERKKLFPEAWGGKCDEELQSISGVHDAVFCHRGRFIATALSKEGAIKLAHLALSS
ncbi:MAG: MYG1 family protein, partial [Parcubacteria group bacterium]